MAADDSDTRAMGRRAREEFEAKYTADRNYGLLMEIYRRALTAKDGRLTNGGMERAGWDAKAC